MSDKNFVRKSVQFNSNMDEAVQCLQSTGRFPSYMEKKMTGTGWGRSRMHLERLSAKGLNAEDNLVLIAAKIRKFSLSSDPIEQQIAEEYISKYVKEPAKQQVAEKSVGNQIKKFGFTKCNKYYYNGQFTGKKPMSVLKSIDFWNDGKNAFVIHKQNEGAGGGQTSDSTEITNQLNEFVKHPQKGWNVVVIFTGTTAYPSLVQEYKHHSFIKFANENNYKKIIGEL